VSTGFGETRFAPRTLAGATILQIVPALREEPNARTAINIAHALLQAGARALVAADDGPLAAELKAFGGEWVPLHNATANPFKLRRNARVLEELIAGERVDIVHAQSVGGAWSARLAAAQIAVWFVTTLPDVPARSKVRAFLASPLVQGDRIIAPSVYAATPMMERYGIPREQITVIPRAIDTATFDPAAVRPERVAALRQAWRIAPGERILLVPGRVAPWAGQSLLPDIARLLADEGHRGFVFVVAGESRSHGRYARAVAKLARTHGVHQFIRLVGHCADMPAAYAAAELVVVPAIEAPILGRVAALAQAMARPVVTAGIGTLAEHVAVPPQISDDLRTGWNVKPGDPPDFAHAIAQALTLDATAYEAMCARSREFAEYMFSQRSIAVATRAVYTSLLARDT
jgi:glycosyltransferase involved in cell wall biosynthesis